MFIYPSKISFELDINTQYYYYSFEGARWLSGVERWPALATGRRGTGSNPTADNFPSELLAIPFTPLCQQAILTLK